MCDLCNFSSSIDEDQLDEYMAPIESDGELKVSLISAYSSTSSLPEVEDAQWSFLFFCFILFPSVSTLQQEDRYDQSFVVYKEFYSEEYVYTHLPPKN